MKGHCSCVATGLSSHAIAQAFGHCDNGGIDHPHDPGDLLRCVNYISEAGIEVQCFRERMSVVSDEWRVLVRNWDELTSMLEKEHPSGWAPETYKRMKHYLREDQP